MATSIPVIQEICTVVCKCSDRAQSGGLRLYRIRVVQYFHFMVSSFCCLCYPSALDLSNCAIPYLAVLLPFSQTCLDCHHVVFECCTISFGTQKVLWDNEALVLSMEVFPHIQLASFFFSFGCHVTFTAYLNKWDFRRKSCSWRRALDSLTLAL